MVFSSSLQSPIGTSVTFASWNVRGLGKPTKLNKVLSHLDSLGAKVAYLQETHLNMSDHMKICRGWVAQSYHSLFNSRARGTAILIHRSLQFTPSDIIADPQGHYIIVTGCIVNTPVILANLYAPSWDNDKFFSDLLCSLSNLDSHFLILGGDFNCCLDPILDRSSTNPSKLCKSAQEINSFLQDYAVSDLWRSMNPTARAYSFFSQVHQTLSRISYFLVDNRLLSSAEACLYNVIVISDHSPLTATFRFAHNTPRPRWRLSSIALSQEEFLQCVADQIGLFVEVNSSPDISNTILWESLKAYLRGQIISYTSYNKKQANQKISDVTARISQLELAYANSPSPNLLQELLLEKLNSTPYHQA